MPSYLAFFLDAAAGAYLFAVLLFLVVIPDVAVDALARVPHRHRGPAVVGLFVAFLASGHRVLVLLS